MDALAVAGDCPLVDDAASAHVVFVHADTAGSLGPAPSGGEAFVAGSPDAVTSMRARLDAYEPTPGAALTPWRRYPDGLDETPPASFHPAVERAVGAAGGTGA